MKIVFIDPPHVYLMQQRTQAPLGLMYLSAVLEKEGHDISIVRMHSLDFADTENIIPAADLYGISAVSLDYSSAKSIARYLRKNRKGRVIIGGYHATCEPDSVLNECLENEEYMWDSVCCGESENSILKIVNDLENGVLKRHYQSKPNIDLNKIPFPARHLIRDQGGAIFAYDKHYSQNRLSTVISSSRGCPFNCAFCSTRCMWEGNVRFRNADNIIKEIELCIEQYGIREFRFSDELFTVNKKRTKELMEWFKGKDIYWKCSTRSDCVNEGILQAMKDGGCKEIAFGIESADPDVLKAINKKNEIKKSIEALEMCDSIGINTRALMMINTPGETLKTVDKNIEFLEKTPYTCASVSVFKPLPGSPAWKNPEQYGIEIYDRDLDKYNIYMWVKGQLEENNSEDVFRILTLPNVEAQIENRKRMLDYFYNTKKMNEIDKAIIQKENMGGKNERY